MKNSILIFSLLLVNFSFAQLHKQCDNLKITMGQKTTQRKLLKEETQPLKKKHLQSEYLKILDKALADLEQCMQESQPSPESLNALKLNYLFGLFLIEQGKYTDAHDAFKFCLTHPMCKTERVRPEEPKTYAFYINNYINCYILPHKSSKKESTTTRTTYVEFATKGGSFMKSLFDGLDGVVFDETALDAEEMESVASKSVYKSDVIDSNLALSLSGSKDYAVSGDFLVMRTEMSYDNPTLIDIPESPSPTQSPESPVNDYAQLLTEYRNLFESLFFDQINVNGRLIPIYLFDSEASSESLKAYFEYCNKMHYRAHKSVAYYQPLDNSIVIWAASGSGTVIHELVHALMANDFISAPLWLNEGIASLYEELKESYIPDNNHRLVLLQQYMISKNQCMIWTELLNTESKIGSDETEMNLFHGFSRYFCKYIYDMYGSEKLSELYKSLRAANSLDPTNQEKLICDLLSSKASKIQMDFENYLMTQFPPDRWLNLEKIYKEDMDKLIQVSFKNKAISNKIAFQELKNSYENPRRSNNMMEQRISK